MIAVDLRDGRPVQASVVLAMRPAPAGMTHREHYHGHTLPVPGGADILGALAYPGDAATVAVAIAVARHCRRVDDCAASGCAQCLEMLAAYYGCGCERRGFLPDGGACGCGGAA